MPQRLRSRRPPADRVGGVSECPDGRSGRPQSRKICGRQNDGVTAEPVRQRDLRRPLRRRLRRLVRADGRRGRRGHRGGGGRSSPTSRPAGPVLELGVGTGRLAVPLAARGLAVTGRRRVGGDARAAGDQAGRPTASPPTAATWPDRCPTAPGPSSRSPATPSSTSPSEDEQRAALDEIRRVLAPGGQPRPRGVRARPVGAGARRSRSARSPSTGCCSSSTATTRSASRPGAPSSS